VLYRMVVLPMTLALGDFLKGRNHFKPSQFLHFALHYACSKLVISATSNLMYR